MYTYGTRWNNHITSIALTGSQTQFPEVSHQPSNLAALPSMCSSHFHHKPNRITIKPHNNIARTCNSSAAHFQKLIRKKDKVKTTIIEKGKIFLKTLVREKFKPAHLCSVSVGR